MWAAASIDIDPARPLQTLHLTGVLAPAEKERFDKLERNLLLWDGISTFTVDQSGRCMIERAVTTYQTNSCLKAENIALAREWEERGWVENVDAFKAALVVERNRDDQSRAARPSGQAAPSRFWRALLDSNQRPSA